MVYTEQREREREGGRERERGGEREREREICAAEKLLLVKILLDEVSFKASLESTERRAVTEIERKRIPNMGNRDAKGTTTMLSILKVGMRKVLSLI